MAAPTILRAAGVAIEQAPHPMDLAALIMSAGLTLKARTSLDAVGFEEALQSAKVHWLTGDEVQAASCLVTVALRARELGDAKTLALVWAKALWWLAHGSEPAREAIP